MLQMAEVMSRQTQMRVVRNEGLSAAALRPFHARWATAKEAGGVKTCDSLKGGGMSYTELIGVESREIQPRLTIYGERSEQTFTHLVIQEKF